METDRRAMLRALALAPLALSVGRARADAGPVFLSCTREPDGGFGVRREGPGAWHQPLPDRGHAIALRPDGGEAVVFARRPGTFAIAFDPQAGTVNHRLAVVEGRRFYGHGVFTADGRTLLATESNLDTGRGVIGIYDAATGYRRVAEWDSGGIGPHDLALMPDGQSLAVANGGILTHPDFGRAKLNVADMDPNLSLLSLTDGQTLAQVRPPDRHHKASIRHLAVHPDGTVALAMQWEGPVHQQAPLVALSDGDRFRAMSAPWAQFAQYTGSIAFTHGGQALTVTSPRGGMIATWHLDRRESPPILLPCVDACGLVPTRAGALVTDGQGGIATLDGDGRAPIGQSPYAWDNHATAL